jgi:glycosyltransferase involved in cell wall biosynthesis
MNKILFFHPRNDFTGSTRVLANIIKSEYSNQKVSVITINKHGFLSDIPDLKIIGVLYLSYKGKKIPILSSVLYQIHVVFLALFYGIMHKQFYINTILPYYAALIGTLYRKKITYHIHEKFVVQSVQTRIAEYVFNHVKSERIFVSEYLKKQYIKKLNCTTVIKYNTLSESFLRQVKVRPIEQRKRSSIIMISSLAEAKGIFMFVEIARLLPQFFFRLIVSADKKSIETYMDKAFPLPPNVNILSTQKNIHPFLGEADLLLNLSNPSLCVETFGMTILEAMAYGIPAIVPNVGGPLELVENGNNGYCIDVTNIDEIILSIYKVFDNNNYSKFAYSSHEKISSFCES